MNKDTAPVLYITFALITNNGQLDIERTIKVSFTDNIIMNKH